MNILQKIARNVRNYNGEGSLQSFYGAVASRNPTGGPNFSESKRDFDALRQSNNRFMIY
jgi:hypothetical protein